MESFSGHAAEGLLGELRIQVGTFIDPEVPERAWGRQAGNLVCMSPSGINLPAIEASRANALLGVEAHVVELVIPLICAGDDARVVTDPASGLNLAWIAITGPFEGALAVQQPHCDGFRAHLEERKRPE